MSWQQFLAARLWQFLALALLLCGSAFFSGTETALFNLTRGQLHRMGRSAHRFARLAAALMTRPQRTLNALLLGNMLVNVAFSGIAAKMVLDMEQAGVSRLAVAAASLAPLLALILGGEVMPKMLAYVLHERWALMAAMPMHLAQRVFRPALWVLEKGLVAPLTTILAPVRQRPTDVTADELDALLELSAKRGTIHPDAGELLQEILDLTVLKVKEIMVPRVDVVAYDVAGPPEGLAELFRRSRLRKIPVFEGGIDNVMGLVHAKEFFLHRRKPLRELVRKVVFVPEAANLERLLLQFRVMRTQTAIVVDEYGGTAGLVSLEDVLEEIVGDIRDGHEVERGPAVQRVDQRRYLLDGDLAIHEWHEAFGMDLSSRGINTVGGFVTSLLGRIPKAGDTATYRNLRFEVEAMRGRRVGTLRLELLEGQP